LRTRRSGEKPRCLFGELHACALERRIQRLQVRDLRRRLAGIRRDELMYPGKRERFREAHA
jgi:hypothetical protein